MKTLILKLILIMSAAILSACASRPTTHYYQLNHSAIIAPNLSPRFAIHVSLAATVPQQALVYQSNPLHIHFARQNLWAAPLSESIATVLSNHFNQNGQIRTMPQHLADASLPIVSIHIDRFQGSYLGQTEINGLFRFPNGQPQSFHILTPQNGDGYEAMVHSLEQGLLQLAQLLASQPNP